MHRPVGRTSLSSPFSSGSGDSLSVVMRMLRVDAIRWGDRVERNRIKKSVGFTLIELMITVVVIAILAAIAYPSYQDHLRKGRRASAQAFMVDAANRQQQYLLDARNY